MSTQQAAWAACSAQSGVLLNSPLAHSGQSKKKQLSIPIQHKAGSKKKDLQLHPCNTLQGIQIPSKHSAAIGVETYQHIQQGLLNPSTYSAGCLTQGTMLDILLSRVRKPSNTAMSAGYQNPSILIIACMCYTLQRAHLALLLLQGANKPFIT